MPKSSPLKFHLHLISDSTGETLTTIAKAVMVQYPLATSIEHVYPLVRTAKQLEKVILDVEQHPGIVLCTIVNEELRHSLKEKCAELNVPCIAVLDTIMKAFSSYIGTPSQPTVAGQHMLDADYFKRIEALNYTLLHDDGQCSDELSKADIVIVGISRTSKTPTSIYLANRGFKTANVPIVPDAYFPDSLEELGNKTFVVGLIASIERISHVRRNRLSDLGDGQMQDYVDPDVIKSEIAFTRRLCARNEWPVIDVTRRSIEETAAAIVRLYQDRKEQIQASQQQQHKAQE